ncbi:acetyl-CoA acetyltransferase [Arthrobacter alpinus]|uniref:Acetyl-CoA acetyltransferase n=1 Tax=Arthrobacter alpinus TaxID=656366 RepID=A0A0M4QF77_9MICC|nr:MULTISPECIES: thiolase family protein [Arthrobacter]ALE92092.1 acetyl-CoA acetyltransferase [Arthrobacter alpinus]
MRNESTDPGRLGADRTAVVIAAMRLPTAKAGGAYKGIRAHELAAPLLQAVLADVGLSAHQVQDVILGNATGGGGNVARLAALTAGFPAHVPGLTVDRQCGSGLEAIVLACRLIQAGAGHTYLAGGVESISTAPARAHRHADGSLEFYDRAQFAPLAEGDPDAGVAAENVASRYAISRERQDAYALDSHHRAGLAARSGRFTRELVPLAGLVEDAGLHRKLTGSLLARFPAAFVAGGTVTAGNSCQNSDGAGAVVVTTLARARDLAGDGLIFRDSATAGNDPTLMGVGAAYSTRTLWQRTLWQRTGPGSDVGLVEFNEAFAAQVLAVADLLELDPAEFNRDGGALALGHPYGASGAISVVRLLAQARVRAEPDLPALAMISVAGGMGISAGFSWENL